MNKSSNKILSAIIATILTMIHNETLPYGRVIRDENGDLLKIVEQKDGNAEESGLDLCRKEGVSCCIDIRIVVAAAINIRNTLTL